MKSKKEMISDLQLLKYLKGEASLEETKMVENWLNEGIVNKSRLDKLVQIWKHSGSLADFNKIKVREDWIKVKARMDFANKQETRRLFDAILRIAAVILILIGISFVVFYYGIGSGSEMIIKTTEKFKSELLLEDGSKIFLNKHSILSYPKGFRKRTRDVYLQGEAYFEVAHNEKKPFIVHTANEGRVQVLGTSFNVESNDESGTTIVYVTEGKVALISSDTEIGKTILLKNEKGMLSASKITKTSFEKSNFLSWKTNILSFENATLEEVVFDLSNYYDTTIVIKDNYKEDNKITTLINNQTLDDVLEELKLVLNIDYSNANGNIVIYKDD